ncbi:enoyl-CoA hydratase-related protein [Microbacterium koreense]|uniref:Enoyl-CoA hydratase-related protein n=1 Tax=Microbacterium koreense TaxID=323761 RepID=A0ABW2ZRU8_9MICO
MNVRFATLRYSVDENIATLELSRPDSGNSFSSVMSADIVAALDLSDEDDDVRAVVITAEGRNFCVGQDLDEGFIARGRPTSPALETYLEQVGTIGGVPRDSGGYTSLRIAASRKPVIAAINGAAVGIGITMLLPADIRVAGESTRLGFVFTRRGLVPEAASSWFLPRIVGISKALEWVETGRLIGSAEALETGLVSYVVDDGLIRDKAYEIAREIAQHTSPVAVSAARATLWAMLTASTPWDAHAIESKAIYDLGGGEDVDEGVAAFMAKRPPHFTSRVSTGLPDFVPEWPGDASTDG